MVEIATGSNAPPVTFSRSDDDNALMAVLGLGVLVLGAGSLYVVRLRRR
jgi:LPXTG-motif cell wall-anchored protein